MQIDELIDNNQRVSKAIWEEEVAFKGKDRVIEYLFKLLGRGYWYNQLTEQFVANEGPSFATTGTPTAFATTGTPEAPIEFLEPRQEGELRRRPHDHTVLTAGTGTAGQVDEAIDRVQDMMDEDAEVAPPRLEPEEVALRQPEPEMTQEEARERSFYDHELARVYDVLMRSPLNEEDTDRAFQEYRTLYHEERASLNRQTELDESVRARAAMMPGTANNEVNTAQTPQLIVHPDQLEAARAILGETTRDTQEEAGDEVFHGVEGGPFRVRENLDETGESEVAEAPDLRRTEPEARESESV